MWAFACSIQADRSADAGRDRFGEKPLYVYRAPEGIYFGSEVKFLFALMGRRCRSTRAPEALSRQRLQGALQDAATLLRGLGRACAAALAPRRRAAAGIGPVLVAAPSPGDDMSYDEAVAGARERLIRSVELRLRADVPIAFCMCGGIDSNALIASPRRELGYDVHGFTIMNTDAATRSATWWSSWCATLGVRHTPIPVRHDGLPAQLRDAGAPARRAGLHHHLLRAVEADGGREAGRLQGLGQRHGGGRAVQRLLRPPQRLPRGDAWSATHACASLAEWRRTWRRSCAIRSCQNPDSSSAALISADHIYLDADAFAQYLVPSFCEPFDEQSYTAPLLRNRMANELFHESVPVILHEDDLNAMYFSVENRSPYLDRGPVRLCYRIPTAHLVHDGRAKAVLRDAVRGIAPDASWTIPARSASTRRVDYLDLANAAVRRNCWPTVRSSISCSATNRARCSRSATCPTARASSCSTSSTPSCSSRSSLAEYGT